MLRAPFLVKSLSHSRDAVKIVWGDNATSLMPSTWLRSMVRDSEFFSESSSMYMDHHLDFILKETVVTGAKATSQPDGDLGSGIEISWDDHASVFDSSWLRVQDPSILSSELRNKDLDPVSWDGSCTHIPEYTFSEKDTHFDSWMKDLRKYGLLVVRDVPNSDKGLRDFMHKIGPLRQRYHPIDYFTLVSVPERAALDIHGYGLKPFNAHTDTSQYPTPAKLLALLGIEYFAPVKDTTTFFADGFKIIEDLREKDPNSFELLTTTLKRFGRRRMGVEEPCDPKDLPQYLWDIQHSCPPIFYDKDLDKVTRLQIFFGKHSGYALNSYPDDHMKRFYHAYKVLQGMLDDPKYHHNVVITPGTLAITDNYRIAHGRGSIGPSTKRTVIGCYTHSEVWDSRWRLLCGKWSGLSSRWLYGCTDEALEALSKRMER